MTFPKLGGPSHYKIVEITCGFEHCMASLYIQDVNKVNEKSLEEKEVMIATSLLPESILYTIPIVHRTCLY